MANTIKIKRSATASKIPLTTDIALGELALNTYDGLLYFKKSPSGVDAIVTTVTTDATQTLSNKTFVAPVLGTPASGNFSSGTFTWPTFNQSTTGNAATATSATSATKLTVADTRSVTTTPETINQNVVFDFKANTSNALIDGGTYHGLMTLRQYGTGTDWSGGKSHQLGFTDNGNIWHRSGSSTTWGTWYKLYDSSNISTLTIGAGLSGTSYNGSTAVTVAIDSTVATLTGTQTLTNKTLTSPTFTTPALGTPASGNFSSGTFTWPTFNQSTTGNASTSTNISNSGTVTLATATESNSIYITAPSYTTDQPVKLLNFDWYGNMYSLGNIRSGNTVSNGLGFYYTPSGGSRTEILRLNGVGALGLNGGANYGTSGQVLTSQGSGAAPIWTTIATSNNSVTTSGSPTTNYIPKFTASTAIGNSLIYDNGTSVGIGTASPSASSKLNVAGVIIGDSDGYFNAVRIGRGSNNDSTNTVLGAFGLYSNTTGTNNTAVGLQALQTNTTGQYNSSFGGLALRDNNTGSQNSAFGYSALAQNTTGYNNSAVGSSVLYNNTTGYGNSAFGYQALVYNTTGNYNTAVGYYALAGNGYYYQSGINNVALGGYALNNNGAGSRNVSIGFSAATENVTGNDTVYIGYSAATGSGYVGDISNSVIIGSGAVSQGWVPNNVIAIGYNAAYAESGSNNISIGTNSAHQGSYDYYWTTSTSWYTYATNNLAIGHDSLYYNTSGSYNVALGNNALKGTSNSIHSGNTAIGVDTIKAVTTGSYNFAGGYRALLANTTGNNNVTVGRESGYNITSGSANVAIGYSALSGITTGSSNICIGTLAGYALTTSATGNVILGGYGGNITALNISTSNNNIVFSDGIPNSDPKLYYLSSTLQWKSATSFDLASGSSYKINNTSVLNATTLGSGVTASSLTSVGTITSGTWSGTIGTASGGSINNTTIGATTASTGAFTTLSASSTVSGTGFSTYLASPPAIGGTAAAAITGTTITANTGFAGPHNGTVGATTPNTGAFTTLSASSTGTTGTLSVTYAPAVAGTSAAILASGDDTQGGVGYFDFLKATNSAVGATNPNKSFRLSSTGQLEIINSAYSSTILSLSDAGLLTPTAVSISAGTTTVAPLQLTSGTNLSTAAAGAVEYDGKAFYATHVASSRGVVPTEQFCCSTSTYTFPTSIATLQKVFNTSTNGALTVAGSTTYFFECSLNLSGMSAVSGNMGFSIGGAGNATFTSASWHAFGLDATTQTGGQAIGGAFSTSAAQTGNIVTAATGTAVSVYIKGVFRVNAGGTIIPSIQLTNAATATVGINSWFKCTPVGTNTVTTVGNWS